MRTRLEHLSKATDRDITWFVVRCLEAHLPEFEKQLKLEEKAWSLLPKQGKRTLPPLLPI